MQADSAIVPQVVDQVVKGGKMTSQVREWENGRMRGRWIIIYPIGLGLDLECDVGNQSRKQAVK